MDLTSEKSLKEAPDFQYVWWKKQSIIQDALFYVGDEFFEKILTLPFYVPHMRKYRDYSRLWSIQELVWAYHDAYDQYPADFTELEKLGLFNLTSEVLSRYTIGTDGIVSDRLIGSLAMMRTLPESQYDLSMISRSELEDYKADVLQYRDVWRSSLDPLGIVLNRYNDGMEVDFFMTPIPSLDGTDLSEVHKIFE